MHLRINPHCSKPNCGRRSRCRSSLHRGRTSRGVTKLQRRKICFSVNLCYLCDAVRCDSEHIYILSESVLAFFFLEILKISMVQEKQHTRHLVLVYLWRHSCPIPQYGCGVLFICAKVFQNLQKNKLIGLTLSFL